MDQSRPYWAREKDGVQPPKELIVDPERLDKLAQIVESSETLLELYDGVSDYFGREIDVSDFSGLGADSGRGNMSLALSQLADEKKWPEPINSEDSKVSKEKLEKVLKALKEKAEAFGRIS